MIRNRSVLAASPAHDVALDCIEAGISAAQPRNVVEASITVRDDALHIGQQRYDLSRFSEVLLLGGGKGAGQLAEALERRLGERLTDGVVVTDEPVESNRVTMYEGNHPVPNEAGVTGTKRLLDVAEEADDRTLVLAVVTGGGSALLPAPAGDVSLADLQAVTDELLASGASIHEINAVRKHLSAIKGGQLASVAAPATVVGVVLSDVVGGDLDVIASGPLVPDRSTFQDAARVVETYELSVPGTVESRLAAGLAGDVPDTPPPGAPVFDGVETHVLADGMTALHAARDVAHQRGYDTVILSSRMRGEAREVAKPLVAVAEEIQQTGAPVSPPAVVLSGGEATVTIRSDGRGGPNQELAVSASLEVADDGIVVASVDTDGIDGASDAAGAIVDRGTAASSDEARAALATNDVSPFLAAADALIHTGPTGTNVNDMQVLVVDALEEDEPTR